MAGAGTGTAIGETSGPTSIVNMALCRIGAPTVNEYETDSSVPAQKARLFYVPERQALIRRHWFRFAASRAVLAESTTAPTCGFDSQFALPTGFLALRYIIDPNSGEPCTVSPDTYAIEGNYILTNESEVEIVYSADVTDTAAFDPLFQKLLVTTLALDLIYPLAKLAAVGAADRIKAELDELLVRVKMMDMAEQNLVGRDSRRTWLGARRGYGGVDPAHLGS